MRADRPVAATIGVVVHRNRVLLIRRANTPDAGRWCFPGGKIDPGETIAGATIRELREETGIDAKPYRVFTAVEAFDRDAAGRLQQHFILIAVLCGWSAGEPVAGDDALAARWFHLDELDILDVAQSIDVAGIARQAVGFGASI